MVTKGRFVENAGDHRVDLDSALVRLVVFELTFVQALLHLGHIALLH